MRVKLTFCAASDIVVTGSNPEMAEYGNPQGYTYGEAWRVVAENDRGDRFYTPVESQEAAEQLASRLMARAAAGAEPADFEEWQPDRPCYGSEAYFEYGQADDLAFEYDRRFD